MTDAPAPVKAAPAQPLVDVRRDLLHALDVIERSLAIQPRTSELRHEGQH